MAAAPPPEGIIANLEHPTDVLRTVNYVTQGLTLFFVTTFVGIRLFGKYRAVGLAFAVDDYLVLISCILMIGYCICGITLGIHGGGLHIWEVPATSVVPFFQSGYAATIFYAPMALFVKLSLLTIIARVFSPYRKTVYAIYVFDALLVGYYGAQLIVKIRICWPISAYWSGDSSKCLDQAAIIMADSITSVISDVVILLLPLPLTWSLQLKTKKKLRVAGMLCVGGLATAFSAWRLHLIIHDGRNPDQSIVFTQVVLSGNAEVGIGLICACLPAVAALFHRATGSTGFGSSKNEPSKNYKLSHLSSTNAARGHNFDNLGSAAVSTNDDALDSKSQDSGDRGLGRLGITRKVEIMHQVTTLSSDQTANSSQDKLCDEERGEQMV